MKAFMLFWLLVRPLAGASRPVLLELFTSQGCSSCPPADRLLEQLDKDQPVEGLEIIPLAFHIDYWNYLGWSDPFSSKEFSRRQYAYAAAWDAGNVYTPEAVINGSTHCNGADREAVLENLKPLKRLALNRNHLGVEISGLIPGASLYIAFSQDGLKSEVKRGENSGRILENDAVVRDLEELSFKGNSALCPVPQESMRQNLVVFQQLPGMGPILSAGRIKL
jgi:hypothetical protein